MSLPLTYRAAHKLDVNSASLTRLQRSATSTQAHSPNAIFSIYTQGCSRCYTKNVSRKRPKLLVGTTLAVSWINASLTARRTLDSGQVEPSERCRKNKQDSQLFKAKDMDFLAGKWDSLQQKCCTSPPCLHGTKLASFRNHKFSWRVVLQLPHWWCADTKCTDNPRRATNDTTPPIQLQWVGGRPRGSAEPPY